MGNGTEESPYTRKDVLSLIEENGGKTEGLDLSGKVFEDGIDLSNLDLAGIILRKAQFLDTRFVNFMVNDYLEEDFLENMQFREAHLWGAHFEGTRLLNAHLEGADLALAHLEKAHLGRTHLEGANLFYANLEGAFLEDAHLEGARLSGTRLKGAVLVLSHLERAFLGNAKFMADTKLESVDWGDYILGEEKNGAFEFVAETYRRLKTWYAEHGMNDIAAKFYYREKEATRKSLKLFSTDWNHHLALQLSYWVFGHGEGWKRLLFGWIAGVIFILAVAYYFWGTFDTASFWDTLYYSATSFSALGYGNWAPQPTGWAKGMGAAEAIIGVFMMALLLVTFVRKWTR